MRAERVWCSGKPRAELAAHRPRRTVIGRAESRYGMAIEACGLTLRLEFASSAQLNSFAHHATAMLFPHFVGDAGFERLVPAECVEALND